MQSREPQIHESKKGKTIVKYRTAQSGTSTALREKFGAEWRLATALRARACPPGAHVTALSLERRFVTKPNRALRTTDTSRRPGRRIPRASGRVSRDRHQRRSRNHL